MSELIDTQTQLEQLQKSGKSADGSSDIGEFILLGKMHSLKVAQLQ